MSKIVPVADLLQGQLALGEQVTVLFYFPEFHALLSLQPMK